MDYIFCFSAFEGIFPLPSEAVDLYINEASLDDLRTLLYVFRHNGGAISEEALCRALTMTPERVRRSLEFWAGKKIFSFKVSAPTATSAAAATPNPAKASAPASPSGKIVEKSRQYDAAEVASLAEGNAEIRFLLETAARLLGRLLSPSECSALIYLYEGAGLPADVIIMLMEYCLSTGHSNIRYIEKTALGWAEDGINTHELAENRIRELEAYRSYEGRVRSIMGITGRALTQSERQHLARWLREWQTPLELVQLAYEICVKRTGKLSFSYINSILGAWHEKGIVTPEQAKNEPKQNRKGLRSPSYDIDEYVNLSMKRLMNE